MGCCKVPGCRKDATKQWALVGLCEFHKDTVEQEQVEFYESNLTRPDFMKDDRRLFYLIVHHMPAAWRRKYIYPKRELEARA